MKRIIFCISLFAFFRSQAQQINPVPDYVFSNKMSVGRNAVTDTAAYFSIGPRYGAIRGMMPPMVTDTASMSATKRNGLLIFSIQKNKYLYWDSVGSKWAEMAGTTGSALTSGDTASMLSPYIRAAGNGLTKSGQSLLVDTASIATRARVQKAVDSLGAVKGSGTVTSVSAGTGMSFTTITSTGSVAADTLTLSTRAWRQKGLDSVASVRVGGSGTTNYIPRFTGTSTLGNSEIYQDGTNIAIGRTIGNAKLDVQVQSDTDNDIARFRRVNAAATDGHYLVLLADPVNNYVTYRSTGTNVGGHIWQIGGTEAMRLTSDNEFLINTTTDAGAYALQVAGSIYNTTGAALAASSGNVGIGTTSPSERLHVNGNILTAAPSGGTAKPFKIGEAATVSPTSPNRTIRVEIDGTVYYIHAKTTND